MFFTFIASMIFGYAVYLIVLECKAELWLYYYGELPFQLIFIPKWSIAMLPFFTFLIRPWPCI